MKVARCDVNVSMKSVKSASRLAQSTSHAATAGPASLCSCDRSFLRESPPATETSLARVAVVQDGDNIAPQSFTDQGGTDEREHLVEPRW